MREMVRRLSQEKASILLLSFVIMTTLVMITLAYIDIVSSQTRLAGGEINNGTAFYLAEGGLNKAVWYLLNTAPDGSTNGSWRTTSYPASAGSGAADPRQESLSAGMYTMWVQNYLGHVLITAAGSINNIARTIRQEVNVVPNTTPQSFKYSQFSGGSISLKNSSGTVTGNLSAVSNVDAGDMTVNGTITQSSTVVSPTVDINAYAAISDHVVNGNYTFGPNLTYTGIWYIDGKITIEDNVTINGSIITTDQIDINNAANFSITPTASNPAIVAGNHINGNNLGAVDVKGLVY